MPFETKTDTQWQPTYVDVSQVSDREHERLEIWFENDMVVMLKLAKDTNGQDILEVDKTNSDMDALEHCHQVVYYYKTETLWHRWHHTYLINTPWNRWRFDQPGDEPLAWPKRQKNLTLDEVYENAIITVSLEFNRSHLRNPAVGKPLGAWIAMPGDARNGSYPVAMGENIVSIKSVVVE